MVQITDEKGEALIGVNVFLDGTTIGTSTDVDGTLLFGQNSHQATTTWCSPTWDMRMQYYNLIEVQWWFKDQKASNDSVSK